MTDLIDLKDAFETRFQKIEAKLGHILQRVNVYDETTSQVQATQNANKAVINNVSDLQSNLQTICKDISDLKDTQKRLLANDQSLGLAHSQAVDKSKQDRQADAQSVADHLSNVDDKHEKLALHVQKISTALYDGMGVFETIKQIFPIYDKQFREINEAVSNYKSIGTNLSGQLVNCLQVMNGIAQEMEKPDPAIAVIESKLGELATNLKSHIYQSEQALLGHKNAIQSQLEALKSSIVPVDLSTCKDQIKGDLTRLIEGQGLDVRNANLKINNNEMNIKLLEKKIENFSLLLKKHELTQ